jgi:three-Cys-motif partner protein
MTQQKMFGGFWTQQKLRAISKYLAAYTKIFSTNQRAKYYETTYVDAFAGTGRLRRPGLGLLRDVPELVEAEEEFQKGARDVPSK